MNMFNNGILTMFHPKGSLILHKKLWAQLLKKAIRAVAIISLKVTRKNISIHGNLVFGSKSCPKTSSKTHKKDVMS
jgi:hypothetical protein